VCSGSPPGLIKGAGKEPDHDKENMMATMTSVDFEKGQAVSLYTEGEWCRGVVTNIDPKSERPYLVQFLVNGVGAEDWVGPEAIKAR
jgi:hypothetical protein